MTFIQWLHRGPIGREMVGGKAASLSALLAGGFEVPLGFAVTAGGYSRFEGEAGMGEKIAHLIDALDPKDGAALRSAAAEAAGLVEAAPIPEDLRGQVAAAYDELVSLSGVPCAVRSSAVSEDGASASFAGLYETYLNVQGIRAVIEALRHCYASLWSERAIRYRALKGLGSDAMAVVVMGLVPSDASGIAFTAHPVTGERDKVVINSSWGLGEAIVSGRVTPDSFVVQKGSFALVERDIYDKELAIYPHPDTGGTIEKTLAPDKAGAPSISDDQACELARIATAVESHFGAPQDVEWGIHDGRLFLLQSRPITTLA